MNTVVVRTTKHLKIKERSLTSQEAPHIGGTNWTSETSSTYVRSEGDDVCCYYTIRRQMYEGKLCTLLRKPYI